MLAGLGVSVVATVPTDGLRYGCGAPFFKQPLKQTAGQGAKHRGLEQRGIATELEVLSKLLLCSFAVMLLVHCSIASKLHSGHFRPRSPFELQTLSMFLVSQTRHGPHTKECHRGHTILAGRCPISLNMGPLSPMSIQLEFDSGIYHTINSKPTSQQPMPTAYYPYRPAYSNSTSDRTQYLLV